MAEALGGFGHTSECLSRVNRSSGQCSCGGRVVADGQSLARRERLLMLADPQAARDYAQLQRLAERNRELKQELARDHEAGLDPRSVLELRLQVLVDTLFDTSTEEGRAGRVRYDLAVERAMAQTLTEVLTRISQAKLAAAGELSDPEMLALSKQQQDMVAAARNLAGLIDPDGPRHQHTRVGDAPVRAQEDRPHR
jgi:hypothetical protein